MAVASVSTITSASAKSWQEGVITEYLVTLRVIFVLEDPAG